MATAHEVLSTIKKATTPATDPTHKIGTVTSASPLHVTWDGEGATTTVYPCISSYTPVVGDRVIASKVGKTWLVNGSLGPPPAPPVQAPTFYVGTVTGYTDSNGYATIYHGCPFTPRAVFLTGDFPSALSSYGSIPMGVDTIGNYTFRTRFFNTVLASGAAFYITYSNGLFYEVSFVCFA